MTLTEFLLARIAEDEQDATVVLELSEPYESQWDAEVHTLATRALAECEAKRRIVRRAQSAEDALREDIDDSTYFIRRSCRDSWRLALTDLASVYADHPDYRDEWRP